MNLFFFWVVKKNIRTHHLGLIFKLVMKQNFLLLWATQSSLYKGRFNTSANSVTNIQAAKIEIEIKFIQTCILSSAVAHIQISNPLGQKLVSF